MLDQLFWTWAQETGPVGQEHCKRPLSSCHVRGLGIGVPMAHISKRVALRTYGNGEIGAIDEVGGHYEGALLPQRCQTKLSI